MYSPHSFAENRSNKDKLESKKTDEDRESAKIHFEAAKKLYKSEKYNEALELFMKAYSRFPKPEIIYNIGKCYDKLGDYDNAVKFYEQYLLLNPQAEDRKEVEELITNLKAALQVPEQKKQKKDRLQRADSKLNYNKIIGYSLSAAGIIFISLGPIFYFKSDAIYNDVKKNNYDDNTKKGKIDDINFYDNLSIASYITGGMLIASSAYFLFKGHNSKGTAVIQPIYKGYLISFQGEF